MKIMKKFIFVISFFIFENNFSSLPLANSGTLSQPKKNTIFGSVQGKASPAKDVVNPFINSSTSVAKSVLPMPVVSDTSVAPVAKIMPANEMKPKIVPEIAKSEAKKMSSIIKTSEPEIKTSQPEVELKTEPEALKKDMDTFDISKHLEVSNKLDTSKQSQVLPSADNKDLEENVPPMHEPGVLYQKSQLAEDKEIISFNFEDASLSNLLTYIESVFGIKFISEDIVTGAKDAKGTPIVSASVTGHKINFRTNKNLTYKEAWDLFVTFMHISGFNIIPMPSDSFYRIVPVAKTVSDTVPVYVGVDHEILPDSDMFVRYVYFSKNLSELAKVQALLTKMQSGSGKLDVYNDLRALIFTDRSSSIKSLMKIVIELDNGMLPEVISVIKLKRANVEDVITLYNALKPAGATATQQGGVKIWTMPKKESSLEYFPADITLVPEPRTNSLVVLGTARDVKRVEDFIVKHIDTELDRKAPPVFTYKLEYTNASDILNTLNKVINYGQSNPGQQYGGVRDGVKFFHKMNIVPDSYTNTLIINSKPEDFEMLKPLIKELDTPQKQIGIEVLLVQVKDIDIKALGAQISGPNGYNSPLLGQPGVNPYGPTVLGSISAQTSGVPSGTNVVVTPGQQQQGQDTNSIKSSLASLLGTSTLNEAGSVLLTFGKPIWAIFKILKTITSTHIISNPFLVVSNNTPAVITSGETRRQLSSSVVNGSAVLTKGLTPIDATLTMNITPLINKGNIINLNIMIQNQTFQDTSSADQDIAPRDTKMIQTIVSVANGETLVLGGIMTEGYKSTSVGVPFLENIPILGWFFKSKSRSVSRDHFMIFICPRVLDPVNDDKHVDEYTQHKLKDVQKHIDLIDETDWFATTKDPIQKAFFGSTHSSLQHLHTGKNYQTRQHLDGKLDGDNFMNTKNSKKQKKSKKVKRTIEEEPTIQPAKKQFKSKNSIATSVAKPVKDVE
jgi:general secretion pathway protein D